MQDGCKVYMDSYMAPNGSCFIVTWTLFKNRLLEVGLTQNRETIALRVLTAVDLSYFIIWLHTTLEGPWPHNMTLEVCWDVWRPLDTFSWALTISQTRLLAHVKCSPNPILQKWKPWDHILKFELGAQDFITLCQLISDTQLFCGCDGECHPLYIFTCVNLSHHYTH